MERPHSSGEKAPVGRGKARRAYHHGNLRQAIIDAALGLVAETGVEAMTLREVARRAGVSSGAPFRHFSDKRDLVLALAEQGMGFLRGAMERRLEETASENPLVKLAVLGRAYVHWAMQHPTHYRILGDRLLIDFYGSERLLADNLWIRETMQRLLASANEQGMLVNPDLAQANLQIRAMAYGLARMLVDGHFREFALNTSESTDAAMTGALDGLLALFSHTPDTVLKEIRAEYRSQTSAVPERNPGGATEK